MARRLAPALAILWLLVPAAAVDPEARSPDVAVDGTVTSLALGERSLAVGTQDPGSRLTGGDPVGGRPGAEVWHVFDTSGRPVLSGRADYTSSSGGCEDRLLDDCAGHVTGVALSGDGSILSVVSRIADSPADEHRGYLQALDPEAGLVAARFLDAVPVATAVSHNGTSIIVAARVDALQGASSRVWTFHLSSAGLTLTSTKTLPGAPRHLAVSPDGQQAILVADQAYRVFLHRAHYMVHGAASTAAIASGATGWAVTGAVDGNVRLFRAEQDAAVYTRTPGGAIGAVAITPDGAAFVAGDAAGRLFLFQRPANGTPAAQPRGSLDLGDAGVSRLAWSADGLLLAAAAGDRVHLVQRTPTGLVPIWSDPLPGPVTALAMAPSGDQVAAAWNTSVRVYEAALDIASQGASLRLDPKGEGNATVTYTNTGNRAVSAALSLRVPAGWEAELSTTQLDLAVGARGEATVHVRAPPDGKPAKTTLWVDHSFDGRTSGTPVGLVVPEVRALTMEPVGAVSAAITAGGSQRFRFQVENAGNVPEEVRLSVDATPGWGALLQNRHFSVAPGGSHTVTLDLEAPRDAVEGDEGTATVSMENGTRITFAAAVGARFGVELTAPTQVDLVPGNVTRFHVEVVNTGNILDGARISMPASSAPPGWAVQFENGLLEFDLAPLQPGEQRLVEVVVQSPRDLPDDGILTLAFTVVSSGDPSRSDDARTVLSVVPEEPVGNDGAAWPLGLLVLGVLWVAGRQRTRPQ